MEFRVLLTLSMNWILKLFISLSLLLSGVFIHLYSHAHEYHSTHSHAVHLQSYLISGKSESPGQNRHNDQAEPTITEDREDDQLITARKFATITNFFASFFSTSLSDNSVGYLKQCLSLGKYFSNSSSFTYIILGVIRI